MSETKTISAEPRDRAGKGAARAVRRAGRVPAVIYGDKKDPVMLSLEPRALQKSLNTGHFFSTVYSLEIGDTVERGLPRDVQFHPITGKAQHVDFLRVSSLTRTNVMVPVVFLNEEDSPGLTRGGMLNVVRHEIEVVCGVDDIPEEIQVDLTGLDIGDSVHFSDITLPEGVNPEIDDRDFTIATIAAPTVHSEEGAEGEEGEEDEDESSDSSED